MRPQMSAFGTKRKSRDVCFESVIWGEADLSPNVG